MLEILIRFNEVIMIGTLIVQGIKNKKQITQRLLGVFKAINETYRSCYKLGEGSLLQGVLVSLGLFNTVIIAIKVYEQTKTLAIIKVLQSLMMISSTYCMMGYVLLCMTTIHQKGPKQSEHSVKTYFLLIYFIISLLGVCVLWFENQMSKYYWEGMLSLAVAYSLDLTMLIKMINPKKDEQDTSSGRAIIVTLLLIVIMNVILFLAVCLTDFSYPETYETATGIMDYWYYTVITFTTIGYGEVTPVNTLGKWLAVIISATSVVCVTIFIGKIVGYHGEEDETS